MTTRVAQLSREDDMSIPNLITILRFLLVPAIVYLLFIGEMELAFAAFMVAGLSDALDGFLARYLDQRTELGAYLDPAADKLLLVSVYIMLGYLGEFPIWLVLLVTFRDLLIIFAVMMSSVMGRPVAMRPLLVSKVNTAAQIGLAALGLAELAFGSLLPSLRTALVAGVSILTVLSAAAYLTDWMRHMAGIGETES